MMQRRLTALMRTVVCPLLLGCGALLASVAAAAARGADPVTLDDIRYSALPGGRARIELQLSAPVPPPRGYTLIEPPRIVLDFPSVRLALAEKTRTFKLGVVQSVAAVQTADLTRVVVKLSRPLPYKVQTVDQTVYITIEDHSASLGGVAALEDAGPISIESIEFLSAQRGEGRIVIGLSQPIVTTEVHVQGAQIIVDLYDAHLPAHLSRRLDVLDFATPVKSIDSFPHRRGTRVLIDTTGLGAHMAYQRDNALTIIVTPVRNETETSAYLPAFWYTHWPLSL